MGGAAADGPGVRLHRPEGEPAALEDGAVGPVHLFVARRRPGIVGVEAVGVLHQKFARPHDAEAGADFIPEFDVDLIEGDGQLPVRGHLVFDQLGYHLFMGGAETELPVVAVLETQQFLAVNVPSPGFLPEFRGLDKGKGDLQGARPVHLLADDLLGFSHHPLGEGEEGVNPGRQLANHAGPEHQAVAHDLRLARVFPQGRYQHLRVRFRR
ncbi:MAG: hypothetical protein BWY29_00453 [Microgenomates group bacterium ADurb.Bin238]|nr:MAG: hypothetical protein BWY29_00453 [Microgenomates group bacterium ADurb.Bin238]